MQGNFILYDGECPACRSYVGIARLRQLWPGLRILDARHEPELVTELRTKGYEINEGFVLSLGGRIYFGPEATRMIGEQGRAHGAVRRIILGAIGTAPWSRRLYPQLNRCRQIVLALLRRSAIR